MFLTNFSSLVVLVSFAHISEGKVYVLRDYDDEPLYIDTESRALHNVADHPKYEYKTFSASNSHKTKPKRPRNAKKTILHYGRHIYHLDSFEDLTRLRSKLNPDFISYDYFDIKNLIGPSDRAGDISWDYVQDPVLLTPKSNYKHKKCTGKECDMLLYKLKYRKRTPDSVEREIKKRRPPIKSLLKRFKIIHNRKRHKRPKHVPVKQIHKKKKPKKKFPKSSSVESGSRESKEAQHTSRESREAKSSSRESREAQSSRREKWKKTSKKYYGSESKSSEEDDSRTTEYNAKKYLDNSRSESRSSEQNLSSESDSIEKEKRQKKKKVHGSSDETKRNIFTTDDMFIQGNKIFNANSVADDLEDKRRRLPQFLPKRYHWDPSEIHDLGYYWFNGPKGQYPYPKPLLYKKK